MSSVDTCFECILGLFGAKEQLSLTDSAVLLRDPEARCGEARASHFVSSL